MRSCIVIGDPVEHSRSPELHNSWYKEYNLDKEFHFSAKKITSTELEDFIKSLKTSSAIRGVSITIPHKQTTIPFLDKIEETAQKIGAVNTIVNNNGELTGYNTDWIGIIKPLKKRVELTDKKVCILGTGGAARAAAWGVLTAGANVKIWGRDLKRAQQLAKEVNAGYIEQLSEIRAAQIIINATSVGMTPNTGFSLLNDKQLTKEQLVFDLVYTPEETELLKRAKKIGASTISGKEMFLTQAAEQFRLYTGEEIQTINFRTCVLKGEI